MPVNAATEDTLAPLAARNGNGRPQSGEPTDYELAQLVAEGSESAFEELYSRHHRRVYGICWKILKNVHQAEDLTQDVFIQLFRKAKNFRGESAFTTWLHRLTVNQVLMHLRKRMVKKEATGEEENSIVQLSDATVAPQRNQDLVRIALGEAIQYLSKGYREVLLLHDVEGYEHQEIARILGIAEGTSKSQLHKARLKMQQLLSLKTGEAPGDDDLAFAATFDAKLGIEVPSVTYRELAELADLAEGDEDEEDDLEYFEFEEEE